MTLQVKDANGTTYYINTSKGDGSVSSPFVVGNDEFIVNETNFVTQYVTNASSKDMSVDGSTTPVIFSSDVVPTGKKLIVARTMIYMESTTSMSSQKFGDLTKLTNGIDLLFNGTVVGTFTCNEEMAIVMYDATGVKNLGKEDKTFLGRWSFSNFLNGAHGVTISAGNTFSVAVNDDLTGLPHLHIVIEGYTTEV